MPELTQFERVKSMMRYLPANGTAGLARCAESTLSLSPWPPARMIATTLRMRVPQCNPRSSEHFQQHGVDVPVQPPDVWQEGLPRHGTVGNHVRKDRELGVARHDARRRRGGQSAALGE